MQQLKIQYHLAFLNFGNFKNLVGMKKISLMSDRQYFPIGQYIYSQLFFKD